MVLIDSCVSDVQYRIKPNLKVTVSGFMGLPQPPDCGEYYDNGQHHAWAECMGVGYK